MWYVKSGEVVIYNSDTRGGGDTLLYAMALGLNSFPPHIGDKLTKDMKIWCEELS